MTESPVTVNRFPDMANLDTFWIHVESPKQAHICFAELPIKVPRINLDSLQGEALEIPDGVSSIALMRTPSPTFQEFLDFVHSAIVPALRVARVALERVVLITDMYGGHANGCCDNASVQD